MNSTYRSRRHGDLCQGPVGFARVAFTIPATWLRLLQIDAAQEHRELFVRDRRRALRRVPIPAESSLLEAFGADPKTRSVPEENLDAVARGVAKDEEMSAGWIEPEAVGDDAVKAIETLSLIHI